MQRPVKDLQPSLTGKRVKPNNIVELVEKIYTQVATNENGKDWFCSLNAEYAKEANSNNKPLKEVWFKHLTNDISSNLAKRVEYRNEHIQSSISPAFSGRRIVSKLKPHKYINDVDLELIKGVVYCEQDGLFYFKRDSSYTLLGSVEELTCKNSNALINLVELYSKQFLEEHGRDFDLINECYLMANEVTKDYFGCRTMIDEAKKSGTLYGNTKVTVLGESVEVYKILKINDYDAIPDEWPELLMNHYVKLLINYKFPAVMLNRNLCDIFYESSDDEGYYFKKFRVDFTDRPPYSTYLIKLFEQFDMVKCNVPKIDVIPHVVSDDNTPARYYIDREWIDKLENQYKIEDCKILKAFLNPYTEDEKYAIMAWAYTVFHPSYGDTINMLFKTGGGTFKTNYYSMMIQKILEKMYNTNKVSYTLQNEFWVKDRFLLEGLNGGVSTAAFVNNDECTIKSIEAFKDFSGGGKNGMNYARRTMRENPTQMKIYSKWLFTTNNDFIIQDDSGAYDRRLFIIDRMDVKKLTPPYSKTEFEGELIKEMKSFYTVAKQSYEQILTNYKSLEDFVTKCSIANNLKKAYAEEDKIWVYYKLTEELYNGSETSLWIPVGDFKTQATKLCEENDVNFNGFKKWLKSNAAEKCICTPIYKQHKFDGINLKGWNLWKLKPEFVPKETETTEIDNLI